MELPATPKNSERLLTALVCATLAGAVVGIYWQITGHDFIGMDDESYITENVHIRKGLTWEGVVWAFTSTPGMWLPLTWLSHMIDVEIYGLNPAGHHFHNILFHAVNSVLVFLALRVLTRKLSPAHTVDFNFWACALAAGLFAVHPLRVESVAWASERKDMLSGFFWYLTLIFYGRYAHSPGLGRYLAVVTGLVLGLMSKPMAVTLPFALLLLDYWPLRRITGENFRRGKRKLLWIALAEKLPMLLIVAGFSAFSYAIGARIGVICDTMPLSTRMANAVVSYMSYLGKMLWPVDLALLYPWETLPWWQIGSAATLLLAITALVFWKTRCAPYLLTGWLWYLGTLVPVIGLVQAGPQAMADRFTYIPCLGVNIIFAWSILSISRGRWLKVLIPMLSFVLAAFMALSFFQAARWRDSFTIYRHTLAITTGNSVINNGMGLAFAKKMDTEQACRYFEEALRIIPQNTYAHNNLGVLYARSGHYRKALFHFTQAVQYQPEAGIYDNLGGVYRCLGMEREAISAYEQALSLQPDFAPAHLHLGLLYTDSLNPREAVQSLLKVVALESANASAHYYLGINYFRMRDTASAMEEYRKLSTLDPEMADKLLGLLR